METITSYSSLQKGKKLDPNNCRPISLLSVPGKLLERVIYKSVDDHTLSNNVLNNRQWCLRKDYSTESLLLHLTESWKRALDNGNEVGVIFLYFSRALDCVDHTILAAKLKAVGVSGYL